MEQDKRVIKTKAAITDAFLALLHKKAIDQITVNDICEKAFISRNTFYAYYTDKYKLLDVLSEQFVKELCDETLNRNVFTGYRPSINEYQASVSKTAQLFFDYLNERREMVVLLSKNNPYFWQTFTDGLFEFTLTYSGSRDDRTRVFVTYSVNAVTGCYKAYFEGRLPMKPQDFIQYLTVVAETANRFMIKSDSF